MSDLYILTGSSGAGKSTAQYVFEELGYFVMDNIMPVAMKSTIEYLHDELPNMNKYLFVVPPGLAEEAIETAKSYEKKYKGLRVILITLTCDSKVLLQRFKLTRHVHPMVAMKNISLSEAIKQDNDYISKLSAVADFRLDTTSMTQLDLRKTLFGIITNRKVDTVSLCFMSFGHKHSIPMDVDLVLDTRALPNPYWVPSLRKYSGLDKPVIKYLENLPITEQTFNSMVQYLDFYIDLVQKDGRGNYTIGVCCSGGRHRSVYFAERLAKHYSKKYAVTTIHRDIDKD